MNAITLMGSILLAIMLAFGHIQGLKSFLSIGINLVTMFLVIRLLSLNFPFLWVTLLGAAIILCAIVYFGVEDTQVADTSFISSAIIVGILILLIIPIYYWAQIQGFGEENTSELESMSLLIGIKFMNISVAMAILSSLGAVAEAAASVASGLKKIQAQQPNLSSSDLFHAGLAFGKQIIGTAFNTLFFGFFGGFLALFIWFVRLNYSFGQFINNKIFVSELLLTLISALGIVLVILLTVKIMAHSSSRRGS